MTKLTNRSVAAARPGMLAVLIWDDELSGFGLRVQPSGVKSFVIQYRNRHNETRRITIGRVGVIAPEKARRKAKREFARIQDGADPAQERKDIRQAETVAELAERYISDYAEQYKKPRSIATDKANIENHVLPLMGRMKVRNVTRADVQRAMRQVREGKTARTLEAKPRGRRIIRGGPGIANRVLRLLGKMFACAQGWDLRPDNPARGIRLFKESPRHRYLDADEIAHLYAALDAAERAGTERPSALAVIRFLGFTGLRRGEALGLRWKDVDMKGGTVQLQETKSGEGREVPIPTPALEALSKLPAGKPDEYVFKGAKEGTVVNPAKPWSRILMSAGLDNTKEIGGVEETVRLHTLRHTVGTWGAAGGASELQLMQILGHKSAATTRRYVATAKEAQRKGTERIARAIQAAGNGNGGVVVSIDRSQG